MILDGNSKVGSAKVYATQKEMDQEKQIEKLKADLKREQDKLEIADNILMAFNEYREATDRKETSKSNTKWHTFERILYDRIKLDWLPARLTQQQRREG